MRVNRGDKTAANIPHEEVWDIIKTSSVCMREGLGEWLGEEL
jgi:hypothetical protein